MMWNSEASKCSSCWNPTSLSVDYWVFCSAVGPCFIQIQKIIPVTFWNSMNLWLTWWEYVFYGHHVIEFRVIHVKFWSFRYVLAYLQTGINSCNWAEEFRLQDCGINVKWKQPFVSASLSLPPKCLQSLIYVVHKLDLSSITLINCCAEYFKMVSLSLF